MTTIFLVGDKCDNDLQYLVLEELSKTYTVTFISEELYVKKGNGYEILVIDTARLPDNCNSNCIILLKRKTVFPNVNIVKSITIIADSEIKSLHDCLTNKQNVIMCGTNKMDTFTYSSLTDEQIMVALTRNISAKSGKTIEPLDLPLKVPQSIKHIYSFLAYTALRLTLDDFNSDIGNIY